MELDRIKKERAEEAAKKVGEGSGDVGNRKVGLLHQPYV